MMNILSYLSMVLILSGAIVLVFAIFKTHKILKLITFKKNKKQWRLLWSLMILFLICYIIALPIIFQNNQEALTSLIGIIFFLGSVFVYLVAFTGIGTFKNLQDINNELENKIGQLKSRNDEITQFNYATSHDLQEPLNTLLTSISFLKEHYSETLSQDSSRFIHYAVIAADRMRELIRSLSNYIKVGMYHEAETTDLNDLIKEVLEEIQGSIQSTEAIIKIDPLPTIKISRIDVKSVFQNLIGNAIKYRKETVKPIITIRAEENFDEKEWLFKVEDNGIGIDDRNLNKVFLLFKQLHNKGIYDGMGLGLAICKKVVEIHGGTIWLDSKKDVGTTFYFTLRNQTSSLISVADNSGH